MLRILSWRLTTLWRNFLLYKKELAQRPIPSDLQRCGVISYKVKRIGRMATKKEVSS
jgi:hypothetical protein